MPKADNSFSLVVRGRACFCLFFLKKENRRDVVSYFLGNQKLYISNVLLIIHMYKKIKFTENTLQVLSLFTNDFNREYYVREVEKLLKISPRTAQLILEDLEDKGIIESKTKGKIKTFKLNSSKFTQRYLAFVEQYKAIAFLEKKLLIKEIIEKITPHIKGIGIIFGSYVKGLEKEGSDLDIFIAGSYNNDEIKRVSKNLGIEISIKCYPLKTFDKNLTKDILLKEVLKNHVVFLNIEQFIRVVFKNG